MACNFVYDQPALAADGYAIPFLNAETCLDQLLEVPYGNCPPFPSRGLAGSGTFDSEANRSGRGYPWKGPPEENPDWRGLTLDTTYFLGLQFAVIIVLYVAPEDLSGWSQEDKDSYSLSRWAENVTNPVWDDDKWYVNYILHPYWGATYYIRGRERGLNRFNSFWYSFFLSALYEFGPEALFEPVSYQDLIVTPVGGFLLGEYLFTPIREWIRAKDRLYWTDKTVLFLTDPLGVVSEELSLLFGIDTGVEFRLNELTTIQQPAWLRDPTDISLPVRRHHSRVWGLQMKIHW